MTGNAELTDARVCTTGVVLSVRSYKYNWKIFRICYSVFCWEEDCDDCTL